MIFGIDEFSYPAKIVLLLVLNHDKVAVSKQRVLPVPVGLSRRAFF